MNRPCVSVNNEKAIHSLIVGMGLLSILVIDLLLTSVLFSIGNSINILIFPFSFCFGAWSILAMNKSEGGCWKFDLMTYIVVVAFALLISSFTYDYSYDGIAYHQDCILQLKEGWNPFYVHHAPSARHDMWVNHYAKGLETIQATVYALTNEIESGKAINFILIISSYFFVNHFFKSIYKEWKQKKRTFYTIIFTFSPVVIAQWFTYYIDFSSYSLLLILLTTLIQITKKITLYQGLCISAVIFLSFLIKFNSAFWIGLTIFCFCLYYLCRKKYNIVCTLVPLSMLVAVLSFCWAGYSPYVTNFLDHGTPFYPLSDELQGVMDCSTPINMRNHSAVYNVLLSFFSYASSSVDNDIFWRLPFTFNIDAIKGIAAADPKTSGFGVLFSGIMILCIFLYSISKMNSRDRKESLAILFVLFISLFILPGGWVARYVPFFYMFPLVMLLSTERAHLSHYGIYLKRLIYLLFIVNIGISFVATSTVNVVYYYRQQKAFALIRSLDNPQIYLKGNVGLRIKLEQRQIPFMEKSDTIGLTYKLEYPSADVLLSSLEVNKE